jgi:hypothetical protein
MGNQMLQSCKGILIVFLTVELGTRWFNRGVAIIAGLVVGLSPVLIEYTTMIGSDMLFTAALLAVIFLFDKNLLQRNASKIASRRPWHSDRISIPVTSARTPSSSNSRFSVLCVKARDYFIAQAILHRCCSYADHRHPMVCAKLCFVR